MAKRMQLNELDDLFNRNQDFELTDAEYEKRVGKILPKTKSAIVGKMTPLGRKAIEKGYEIRVEDRPIIQRVIIFTKRRESL